MSRIITNLRRNPAAVRTIILAAFVIAAALGFEVTQPVQEAVVTLAVTVVALVLGATTTPNSDVVAQVTPAGEVVAAAAHPEPSGTPVVVAPTAPPGAVTTEPLPASAPEDLGTS